MYWNDLLHQVLNKKSNQQKFSFNNIGLQYDRYKPPRESIKPLQRRILRIYSLGTKYGTKYFTQREAECMAWLLKGKTINRIAQTLRLSPRTVEYYVKNMKIKVGCRTKFELIDLISESDFVKAIDLVNSSTEKKD